MQPDLWQAQTPKYNRASVKERLLACSMELFYKEAHVHSLCNWEGITQRCAIVKRDRHHP